VEDGRKQPAGPLAKQALSHPERFEMLDCITQRGAGIGEAELAEALGLPAVKVRYHLTVLRNADLVAYLEETAGRYVAAASP
jgi:predicted ArsR family transcriptional regulator